MLPLSLTIPPQDASNGRGTFDIILDEANIELALEQAGGAQARISTTTTTNTSTHRA